MDFEYIVLIVIGIIIAIICIINKIHTDIILEKKKGLSLKNDIDMKEILLNQKERELEKKEKLVEQKDIELKNIISEKTQKFPYLSSILSEWQYLQDISVANMLARKKRPALKAAEEVRKISAEKRIVDQKCRDFEHQIKMYEALFPWLEEFKELPPEEAYKYVSDQDDEYSRLKDWLSPEEYSKLSNSEKCQLALDRYVNRKNKTNWHIGIEYERYIGYVCELSGYTVHYEGALLGLEDKGRDLIIEHGDNSFVIQCKRWAKEKQIHEKHIMQLFGSVTELNLRTGKNYRGVLITTATLSDVAKHFSELLNVYVIENYEQRPYPLIKCNISKNGEKIYHLPFDQQYDRIHIDFNKGNMYVNTVSEAEKKGFRHAFKWKGENIN